MNSLKLLVQKTGALLLALGIGLSILYGASSQKSQNQNQTSSQTSSQTSGEESTVECQELWKKLEAEREKRDRYLSTTKSGVPRFEPTTLEKEWEASCAGSSGQKSEDKPDQENPDF